MELAASSMGDSNKVARLKNTQRSRVTNGRDVLPNVDGRSIIAKRYKEIANAILVDQGGVDQCSESRKQLIRRFAAASVLAEQMESKLANGEEINVQEHALLVSSLVRVANKLGINRVTRDLGPTLSDYFRKAPPP